METVLVNLVNDLSLETHRGTSTLKILLDLSEVVW